MQTYRYRRHRAPGARLRLCKSLLVVLVMLLAILEVCRTQRAFGIARRIRRTARLLVVLLARPGLGEVVFSEEGIIGDVVARLEVSSQQIILMVVLGSSNAVSGHHWRRIRADLEVPWPAGRRTARLGRLCASGLFVALAALVMAGGRGPRRSMGIRIRIRISCVCRPC